MENWKKIRSFNRAHEAELRKEVLKNNNIVAVILARQDSAFLIGDFELFVEEQKLEAAGIIIEEFKGWTKVNSFSVLKPVKTVEEYLTKQEIEVFFTRNNQLGEYEVYVKNEEAERALNVINTVKPWVLLSSFITSEQAAYRSEQLAKYDINSIAIKRRTPEKQLISVDLLVGTSNYKVAVEVIKDMVGWDFIAQYDEKTKALLTQKMLEKEGIDVLADYVYSLDEKIKKIELFVERENTERSKTLIDENREWIKFAGYKKLYQIEMVQEILKQNNIDSVFISEKGSMFLFGEMIIYVEKHNLEKAKKYIKSWKDAFQDIEMEE